MSCQNRPNQWVWILEFFAVDLKRRDIFLDRGCILVDKRGSMKYASTRANARAELLVDLTIGDENAPDAVDYWRWHNLHI